MITPAITMTWVVAADQPAAELGYDCFGNCLTDTDEDGICDEFEILGCLDVNACNYGT